MQGEGYWANYDTGKIFPIDEHERWLRTPGNAKKLGLSPKVISMFKSFRVEKDRDKFLMFVVAHAPVIRIRGHGYSTTFEYSSHSKREPLDVIWKYGKQNFGEASGLYIVNFATHESVQMSYQEFEDNMQSGGYDKVMRAASEMVIHKRIAIELLALSKELLRE